MIIMIIGIDARSLLQEGNGIKVYSYNLLKSLAKIDHKNDYILFLNKPSQFNLFKQRVNQVNPLLWKFFFVTYNIRKEKVDVFHSLAPSLPPLHFPSYRCQFTCTVYDLTFKIFSDKLPLKECLYWAITANMAFRVADRIIAISKATKEDLLRIYEIPETKIEVIYCGLDEIFRPITDTNLLEEIKKKYRLPEKFILCVGGNHYRKNIPILLKAFSKLKKFNVDQKLVVLRTQLTSFLFQLLKKLNIEKDVTFMEWIPRKHLPSIYSLASISVYPSLYEGFGLPPLESMACGTPVVASNVSSIPEVVGDAGILVNPFSPDEFAQAMYNLLTDKNLYLKFKNKGLERAKNFTWDESARKTLRIWESLSGELKNEFKN
jgi:glycosyltransferase involved in cell wall biosynthesis